YRDAQANLEDARSITSAKEAVKASDMARDKTIQADNLIKNAPAEDNEQGRQARAEADALRKEAAEANNLAETHRLEAARHLAQADVYRKQAELSKAEATDNEHTFLSGLDDIFKNESVRAKEAEVARAEANRLQVEIEAKSEQLKNLSNA